MVNLIQPSKSRVIRTIMITLFLILSCSNFVFSVNANSNQLMLSEISTIPYSRTCDVKVDNNILYVLTADYGLMTYNISDPTSPALLDHCTDTYAFAHSLVITDMHAYIADYEDGLEIVNISDPTDIRIIGQYAANVGSTAGSTDVHRAGDLVFLASQNMGLEIINCSNSIAPVKIGSYYENQRVIRVYTSSDQVFISEAGNGFKILNITDDGCTEIFHFRDTVSYQDFFVHSDLLYVTDHIFGIRIFDLNNLSNIVKVGEKAIGTSYGLVIEKRKGNLLAYVSSWDSGLQILNIDDPDNIQVVAQYTNGGKPFNVALKEELIFVADFQDGLEILQMYDNNSISSTITSSIISETIGSSTGTESTDTQGFELIFILAAFLFFINKRKKHS